MEVIGVGAVGAGLLVSARSRGIWRSGATGLMAAGASIVAVEVLRRLFGATLQSQRRQTAPSEVITRKELQEALGRAGKGQSHVPPQQEPPLTVARIGEHRRRQTADGGQDHLAAVVAQLDSADRAALDRLRETTAAPVFAQVEQQLRSMSIDDGVYFLRKHVLPHARHREAARGSLVLRDDIGDRPGRSATASGLSREKLVEILGKLQPHERGVVARKLDQAGSDVFERTMRYLAGLSVDEAAAWTRSYFLEQENPTNGHAAPPNSHAS